MNARRRRDSVSPREDADADQREAIRQRQLDRRPVRVVVGLAGAAPRRVSNDRGANAAAAVTRSAHATTPRAAARRRGGATTRWHGGIFAPQAQALARNVTSAASERFLHTKLARHDGRRFIDQQRSAQLVVATGRRASTDLRNRSSAAH